MQILKSPSSARCWNIAVLAIAGLVTTLAPAQTKRPDSLADSATNDEVVTIPEFQVTESYARDAWFASQAMSGTRAAASILELPYQVQVLTQELNGNCGCWGWG